MIIRPLDPQLQVMTAMRFPLVVCVLLVYANFQSQLPAWGDAPVVARAAELVSGRLAPIAFPAFCFLSSLQFFRIGEFSRKDYPRKMLVCFRTLFVPYLIWSLFYFGLRLAGAPVLAIGNPMWLLRDLWIVSLFTPLIYYGLRQLLRLPDWTHSLLALGVLFVMAKWSRWPDVLASSFVFYVFGAYFGVRKLNLVQFFRRYTVVLLFSAVVMFHYEMDAAAHFLLILAAFPLLGDAVEKGKMLIYQRLTSASFLIFAAFYLLYCAFIAAVQADIIAPEGELGVLLCYLGLPVAFVLFGLALHVLLDKSCPRVLCWLTGGWG